MMGSEEKEDSDQGNQPGSDHSFSSSTVGAMSLARMQHTDSYHAN